MTEIVQKFEDLNSVICHCTQYIDNIEEEEQEITLEESQELRRHKFYAKIKMKDLQKSFKLMKKRIECFEKFRELKM